ncbi:MAG TPA: xanthine dehydrogenase small subunit [Alcaligenes sp.]|nr:xanthine dehydrogenase small subunit [Alcaligenes sp.]HRL27462.1 xanthine dehydrogenase small subunit [Alcaligenes sp.]
METRPIRFIYRGQVQEVTQSPATQTVLQYIREDLHCTGTKEGCAEGDCGACTVMVGELDGDQRLQLRAVNACIQLLPTLDGKVLYTVEDLRQADGSLHPVQQAMVDLHGAQCGFCTPGFIMSLWGLYLSHPQDAPPPTRAQIDDVLSGNLCRCTGYRPIIDAAQAMHRYPRAHFDRDAVEKQLRAIQSGPMLAYRHQDQTFHAPRTLDELAHLREQFPQARILAGSTDIGLWVTKQFRDLPHLIYIGRVAELRELAPTAQDDLYIGAGVLLNDAFDALLNDHPELTELRQRFASFPIRNAGTLGGNVANGSPIGDSMPALIALRTRVMLRKGERVRILPLEDLYLAYQKTAMEPGEFVQGLLVPRNKSGWQLRTYKLSKRFDQDISAVCAAFAIELDGTRVRQARIAFGGMAATPKRAAHAELALHGQPWNENSVQAAMQALQQDYQPLSDMRASSQYRSQTAANLLYRFYLETRPDTPLRPDQLSVFTRPPVRQEAQP